MIRLELINMLRRRRTWVTIVMLNALPTIVAVLLALTDLGPRPGTGPPFLSAVLTDGTQYPLAALAIVLPLFLPVAVAVIAGDAIAGEAQSGTLRYLLIRPVGRTRLLVAKLVSVIAFVLVAVVIVAAVAYVEGRLLLGSGDPSGTVTSVSGTSLTQADMIQRTLLSLGYVTVMMLGVAAIALMFSTFTDTGIVASLGTVAILIASTVLLGLDAANAIQPYLPTRYWLAFVDLFRDPIRWTEVLKGLASQAAYLVVFLGAAWANFSTKDINS